MYRWGRTVEKKRLGASCKKWIGQMVFVNFAGPGTAVVVWVVGSDECRKFVKSVSNLSRPLSREEIDRLVSDALAPARFS